jgi:prophage regulatory protein
MKFIYHADLKAYGITFNRSTIWRMERDGKFPKRVPIGESRVGWIEDEIKAWMQARIEARNAGRPAAA